MALPSTDRKLFLGARMKRMRRELGLTQTRMAEDLGVSPSYLNLLERNQRPVTAQVLLRCVGCPQARAQEAVQGQQIERGLHVIAVRSQGGVQRVCAPRGDQSARLANSAVDK